MTAPEKRRWPRYPTKWRAIVPLTDASRASLRVLNASEGGLFVAMNNPPAVRAWMVVEVDLGHKRVTLAGEVVHRHLEPGGVGVELMLRPKEWKELVESLAGA